MQHGVKRFTLSEEAKQAKKEKDAAKIRQYQLLVNEVLANRDAGVLDTASLELTTNLLNLNPELYTIWNYRRDILVSAELNDGKKTRLEYDLKMVMAFLKQYPKCYWVWNHRTWCLQELSSMGAANWQYELAIVEKLLLLDARNFHGWQYRRYIVENIENETKTATSAQNVDPLLEITYKEYLYTTSKVNKNISNFSAWHNRSKLIPRLYHLWQANRIHVETPDTQFPELVAGFSTPYDILVRELELLKTGMYMDADDTSVWLYLQWLLTENLFVENFHKNAENKLYLMVLKEQLEVIQELNELEKDDHPENRDNAWCLKSMVFLKELIARETNGNLQDVVDIYQKLVNIDPIRKGRYLERIQSISV